MADAVVRRVVVKVGSSSLTDDLGRLDPLRVRAVVADVSAVRKSGVQVVVVTSGAIAAGLDLLGLAKRPTDIPTLQAAASVGQGQLVHEYRKAFGRRSVHVGQVLLTQSDILHRESYVHAHDALERLLSLGVVPIVNENDATGVAEIRFGDNDRLAALVAVMVRADLLVILSDVDGIYTEDPRRGLGTKLELVSDPVSLDAVRGGATGSKVGSGGMASKIEAMRTVSAAGITGVVAAADTPKVVERVVSGESIGTKVLPSRGRTQHRKAWIAFARSTRGRITVDDGARVALSDGKKSLLPAGIVAVDGAFIVGDVVEIADAAGSVFGRGVVSYAADELPPLLGQRLPDGAREVVHRDSLVIL